MKATAFVAAVVAAGSTAAGIFVAPAARSEEAGTVTKEGTRPQETIGTAWLAPDGTLVLDLRAEGPKGELGDARLFVPKSDERYKSMLDHIGGLKPGEVKTVKPFE